MVTQQKRCTHQEISVLFYYTESSHISDFFSQKRPIFLFACTTCSELPIPSNITTVSRQYLIYSNSTDVWLRMPRARRNHISSNHCREVRQWLKDGNAQFFKVTFRSLAAQKHEIKTINKNYKKYSVFKETF